jgi:hypothetical protein
MRFRLVRLWAGAAAAILAAAAADAGTEFAENSGWLGGTLHDSQHEAILPALGLGAAVTVSLTIFILFARISPRDPLLLRLNGFRSRLFDIACAFCGSMLCVIAMEGYETRFGGLSPFDPRSVVLSHTLALVIAFLVAGAIVHCALRGAIGAASRASNVVVDFLVEFLRKVLRSVVPPRAVALSAFRLYVPHVPPGIAGGSRGFRAPPRAILSGYFVT